MSIQVAPGAWGQVFAVPAAVVDSHIALASGQQLKVLLYVLRHNGEDMEVRDIADGLGMSAADTADAMQYWLTTGFLLRTQVEPSAGAAPAAQTKPAQQATPAAAPAPNAPKPYTRQGANAGQGTGAAPKAPASAHTSTPLQELPDIKPTYETVAARLQEDPEFQGLCNEVQALLGRTIGFDTQATLLMMHDTYGLPCDVILTVVEYSQRHGKGIPYMTKVAKNWAEEGVDTLDAAMEKLEVLERTDRAWKEFTSVFTMNPPKVSEKRLAFVKKWRLTFGQSPELMHYAYEIMVDTIDKVNFAYMDKILTRWNEEGLRTPQEVLQAEQSGSTGDSPTRARGGKKSKIPGDHHTASYDSDAYREKARGPITYPGKKKSE